MRPTTVVLGVLGAAALVVAVVVALAIGDPGLAGWVLVGPGPFFGAGLFVALRRPGRPAGTWCLLTGTGFMVSVCLGDAVLSAVAEWPGRWLVVLFRQWADYATGVGAIGLFGWFPDGRPQRPAERRVVQVAAVTAALLPLAYAITNPMMAAGAYPNPDAPAVPSPLFRPALAAAGPVVGAIDATYVGWILLGFGMLALRYRHASLDQRRRIRLLLLGMGVGIVLFAAQFTAMRLLEDAGGRMVGLLLWPVILVVMLGSMVIGVAYDGVFAVDEPLRRSVLYRALWALIAAFYVAAAAALGVLAARFLSVGVAVLLAAGAALLFQPVQRRLERIADRWVFGPRLDGYRVLARFGTALESAPQPADLLTAIAEAVRDGLALTWVRVRLDLPDPPPAAGGLAAAGAGGGPASLPRAGLACAGGGEPAEPALVVPLVEGGEELGRIECGPRHDGPLLDEERRLLQQLARQAATAVRNLHLTAELTTRLAVIRRQADDLAASRARIVTAQDAERRRIQRDLHDGVQQEIVALSAKLAMARQRSQRGDRTADQLLAEVQGDVIALLNEVREFAHAIHPPVLADKGLLEAIEAQAARLPLGVVIETDAALRGVHFPQQVEATAWYVISEALTNVVKHARARQVRVRLAQPDGRLTVEICDDGAGFDPRTVGGLGLAGLADRISTIDGTLRLDSAPGRGTTLRAEIPLPEVRDA
ncbi:sensor histidine kinase [Nonomuraea basaltis]|uniref:sensor histidine kinase n=1 Tax=Nonomuraea basaltis TaxID=2495887 RepID=UPI00110C4DF0|nr:GAF domain-containing sensor histidine kinase [Nonomuraea basaltis]TMR88630.1 GAF domain-containing sensor histidine kinase [Nonomuraea basaltis]